MPPQARAPRNFTALACRGNLHSARVTQQSLAIIPARTLRRALYNYSAFGNLNLVPPDAAAASSQKMSDELLSPDDLWRVLGDKLVVQCVRWQDIGLRLGVKKRKLDEIEADCRGKTVDCKREMFSDWLDNTETPTMDEIRKVINEVNERDKREQWREETSKNEEEAVKATNTLLHLLDEWEKTNQELYGNQQQCAEDLDEVKHWMEDTLKRKWKEEDMQEEHVHAMERGRENSRSS